jgi:hypothetical protein
MSDTPARPDAGTTLEQRLRTHDCDERSGGCELLREDAADTIEALTAERARLEAEVARLRSEAARIADDYHPAAPGMEVLALDEMREAIAALALTSAGEGCSTCGGVREIDTGGRGEMASRIVPCPDCEGEEPNTATDYYHAEMQRLSGEGEPSAGEEPSRPVPPQEEYECPRCGEVIPAGWFHGCD